MNHTSTSRSTRTGGWSGLRKAARAVFAAAVIWLAGVQLASAHGVQVAYCLQSNGFLRVYIEHWHGQLSQANLSNNGATITTNIGGNFVTQSLDADGFANNTSINNLPGCENNITVLAGCAGLANTYNNWVYYDFAPPAFGQQISIVIDQGNTALLTEACPELFPTAPITATFVDTQGPALDCNDVTVAASCNPVAVNYNKTVLDNSDPNPTVTYTPADGSVFAPGVTTVTAFGQDNLGNTSTCTFDVIVPEPAGGCCSDLPQAFCQNATISLDASGNATLTPADIDAGSNAPCGGAVLSLDRTAFSCADLGASSAQTSTIAFTSFEEPAADGFYTDLGDATVDHDLVNNAGEASVDYTAAGGEMGFDSRYVATGSNGLTDGDFVGVTTYAGVVGAYTDGSNGFQMSDTDGEMVVDFDVVNVAGYSNVNLSLDYFIQNTGYESSDNLTISVSVDGGTAVELLNISEPGLEGAAGVWNNAAYAVPAGASTVQLSVSFASNSSSEAVYLDNVSITGETAAPGIPVTLTITDNNGATASCSAFVTVVDNEAPVIECPEDYASDCAGDVSPNALGFATATDNCGAVDISYEDELEDGGCANLFLITRTWTATDASGNSSSCDQEIFVIDEEEPEFVACAADITIECDVTPSPSNTGFPTAVDNCNGGDAGIWINEFHYDNASGDVGEFVEVAGAAGTDLSAFDIVLYNGSNGASYNTVSLSGTIDNEQNGVGAVAFYIAGIQNGGPDGMALVSGSDVIEFISYEGSFVATNGPAAGMTSTDIGISEPSSQAIGEALGLIGTGNASGEFTWADAAETPGSLNGDQEIDAPITAGVTLAFEDDVVAGSCPGNYSIIRTWTAIDACGNEAECVQTIHVEDNTAPEFTFVPESTEIECDEDDSPAGLGYAAASDNCGPEIWINEFHYDNASSDVGEFVEVAGPANTDLSAYSLVMYNGSNGTEYNTVALSGVIDDEGNGFGAVDFQLPANGLQNGSPDGIALVKGASVIEFLSYEGSFTAVGGVADGQASTDVLVSETSSTPIGESLQREGTGGAGFDFAWAGPSVASPGSLNANQNVAAGASVAVTYTDEVFDVDCPNQKYIIRTWIATDACGNVAEEQQEIFVDDTTNPILVCADDITIECDQEPSTDLTGEAEASDNCSSFFDGLTVWVNELHYDNASSDVGEFVEVAGQAGTDLAGWSIALYNGSSSQRNVYGTIPLAGVIADEGNGFGALAFYRSGIQNGGPDGLALVNSNDEVVQFLSYEGVFEAADGPAVGMTSESIGVYESSGTAVGESLQLSGSGATYGDFEWDYNVAETPGVLNADQVLEGAGGGGLTLTYSDVFTPGACAGSGSIARTWVAEDACGNTSSCVQTITIVDTTAPELVCPADQTIECTEIPDPSNTGQATATDNCSTGSGPTVWINEFHYDNNGSDVNEFIEVAGNAGIDLIDYTLVLYNGNGGGSYNTIALSGVIDDESNGIGAVDFQLPANGLQNGSPDGIALIGPGGVIEFISYEGTFVAADGPAAGMSSIDVGVEEPFFTDPNESLQLLGPGAVSADFYWSEPSIASPGSLNNGQTINTVVVGGVTIEYSDAVFAGSCPNESTVERTWTAIDECGNMSSCTQTITIVDTTPPTLELPEDAEVECDEDNSPAALGTAEAGDSCGPEIWINEIHYDNAGTDQGEFIEVAGTAGLDLSAYTLELYNGNANVLTPYNIVSLSGNIDDEGAGYGAISYDFPSNGLQNGSPDGIALVKNGAVVQFISYEGSFTAAGGSAAGQTSMDIGVEEDFNTQIGESLQLSGVGQCGLDFAWGGPSAATPGSLNAGQSFLPGLAPTVTYTDNITAGDCPNQYLIERVWTATDACGNTTTDSQFIFVDDTTNPTIDAVASDATVECDGAGNGAELQAWLNSNGGAAASDNCGAITWSNDFSGLSDDCGATGSATVTFTATDECGNASSTAATFTIEDTTSPDLACPADISLATCDSIATWDVISSDDCSGVTVVSTPASGSIFAIGTTTVTVVSTDACGNSSSCTFDVVRDPAIELTVDPVAVAPYNTCASGGAANIIIGYGGVDCTSLGVNAIGGAPGYSYEWTAPAAVPAGAFTNINSANPTFCADFQTTACVTYTFNVVVTDSRGCTETASVDVNVVNVNVDENGDLCGKPNNPKVIVCHIPPGNPANAHNICISANAVPAHLNNHGDCLGSCNASQACSSETPQAGAKLAADENNSIISDELSLEAFPNPFSSEATIRLTMNEDTRIQLRVMNAAGQLVDVLFEGNVQAGAAYQFTLDGAELPTGMYFYSVVTDTKVYSGKIMLQK